MDQSFAIEHRLVIDGEAYDLVWLEAREAVDDLGILRCEITDHAGGPDPAALVGKKIEIELSIAETDEERKLVAYVVEAERTTTDGQHETGTRVVARPLLHRLTQRADCRVFQDMSAPDIAKRVLAGAGVPAANQSWQLSDSYPERTYTTQYREADFDFLRRLLSEEGIAFAVDSSGGTDLVEFFDSDLGAVTGDAQLAFRPAEGLVGIHDAITALSHERSTAPGKVHLRDYDFEHPQLKLDAKATGEDDTEHALEIYDYPGRFTSPSTGDRYAKVLLESLRARRELVSGTTSTLRLQPGRTFELVEHPYEPLNREYLVLEVEIFHDARRATVPGAGGHRSRIAFRASPSDSRYRPPRVPRALHAPGAQIAVTTGPAGKEIHPDEHGRVKVLFPWDRLGKPDDTSSLWIRTCQLPVGGSMLTPRVGWEVYLNFIDGDPDRPFVFGRMYNGTTRPAYPLPRHKTRMALQTATTPGGGSTNEIRMDDAKGSEEMFMNASKDGTISAGNNATEDIGNNETRSIGANHALSVTGAKSAKVGADQSVSIGADQTVHVSTFMVDEVGSHSLTISGERDLKAGGDHKRTVTGASTLTIDGMQVDLVAGSVDEEGMATMEDTVSGALIEMTASDRTVTVTGNRTEKAGLAKAILAGGGRSVQVGANLNHRVTGAILTKISGDRADSSDGDFFEVAGGAQIIKATNVVFEADELLSVVMGASTITLTPLSVSIAGVKITLDGDCNQESILIADN